MVFSLSNAKESLDFLKNGFYASYDFIDQRKYEAVRALFQKEKLFTYEKAFRCLNTRLSKRYFYDILFFQLTALDYSTAVFPSYVFIMAEDLIDDWLATVDPHKDFARDHNVHQPLTASIAAKLLGYGDSSRALKIPLSPGNLLDYCIEKVIGPRCASFLSYAKDFGLPSCYFCDDKSKALSKEVWKSLFYQSVILAALFHDMGYPWQYVHRVDKTLRMIDIRKFASESFSADIARRFKDRLVLFPFQSYCYPDNQPLFNKEEELNKKIEIALNNTHGFPGALSFLSLHDAVKSFPPQSTYSRVRDFSVEWAALGILMHDMPGIHKKNWPDLRIDFEKDPLSCIISLADYLEEFNRPYAEFRHSSHNKNNAKLISYKIACESSSISISKAGVMTIEMSYKDKRSYALANDFKRTETEDYFNLCNGYMDLSSIGVNRVEFHPKLIK